MSSPPLEVLIVDDDFRVAALHAGVVDAVGGLAVVARAGSIAQAMAAISDHPNISLALIDVHLPDGFGLDLLARIDCDAFVLSAETDGGAVRRALRMGALTYLIKPFDNTELARRLSAYLQYRRILAEPTLEQEAVDAALGALRFGRASREIIETGSRTEELILRTFADTDTSMFADEVSAAVGISPPTARRHLANLVASGKLTMRLRYGATGRPKQEYRRHS